MKKLFTLLFTGTLALSLAMPVFAQDTGSQEAPTTAKTKAAKTKKTSSEKMQEAPK